MIAELCAAGGRNWFGEPNYRIVWGWNRLGWIGGLWKDFSESGELLREVIELRYVPLHLPLDRWHLERWMPPQMYGTPQSWYRETREAGIDSLGPFPQRGEYEHVMVIDQPCQLCVKKKRPNSCEHRQFAQLTLTIVQTLVHAIEFSRSLKEEQRREATNRRLERERIEDDAAIEEVLNSDPDPISPERKHEIEYELAPAMEVAMTRAAKRNRRKRADKCSAGLPGRRRKR